MIEEGNIAEATHGRTSRFMMFKKLSNVALRFCGFQSEFTELKESAYGLTLEESMALCNGMDKCYGFDYIPDKKLTWFCTERYKEQFEEASEATHYYKYVPNKEQKLQEMRTNI